MSEGHVAYWYLADGAIVGAGTKHLARELGSTAALYVAAAAALSSM